MTFYSWYLYDTVEHAKLWHMWADGQCQSPQDTVLWPCSWPGGSPPDGSICEFPLQQQQGEGRPCSLMTHKSRVSHGNAGHAEPKHHSQSRTVFMSEICRPTDPPESPGLRSLSPWSEETPQCGEARWASESKHKGLMGSHGESQVRPSQPVKVLEY